MNSLEQLPTNVDFFVEQDRVIALQFSCRYSVTEIISLSELPFYYKMSIMYQKVSAGTDKVYNTFAHKNKHTGCNKSLDGSGVELTMTTQRRKTSKQREQTALQSTTHIHIWVRARLEFIVESM